MVAIGGAAAAAVTLWETSFDGRGSHQAIQRPTAGVATATAGYLAGPGVVLDRRHQAAAAVVALSPAADAATCHAAQQAVDVAGSVEDVLVAIQAVPDEVLRQLLVGEFSAESAVLNACGASTHDAMRDRLEDVARFHAAVASRRALVQREAGT